MGRVGLFVLVGTLVASLGAGANGQRAVPLPPTATPGTVVAPDWQLNTSRLGTGPWHLIRSFALTVPNNPAECRLACERSLLCSAWTMVLHGRRPYDLSADTCTLSALALPSHFDRCCVTGVRRSALPTIPETFTGATGSSETYVANSSYMESAVHIAFLRRDATPWSCRQACIEQRQNTEPGTSRCSFWTYAPPGRDPSGSDRFARCFYSATGTLVRRAGWTAGGPVPPR